jgi:hypothetical protein
MTTQQHKSALTLVANVGANFLKGERGKAKGEREKGKGERGKGEHRCTLMNTDGGMNADGRRRTTDER